ncbi:hypothetical protein PHMEG_00034499, partial [Phytophthora megakarya]
PSDDMSGRYNNAELIDYTKVLSKSQPIKLPKLHTKGDYKAWRSEVPLHFETRMLGDITSGGELDLRTTFKNDDIRDSMDDAALLYSCITQHFEAADGIIPDYLLQELVTRKLQPNESVTAYVKDIARKWEHASLLLSNCVEKFHDLAREHGDWINNHNRKTMSLTEALQHMRAAEHQRVQPRMQTRQTALRPMQVAYVNIGQGQGQRGHRKRSQQQRKCGKTAAKKKQRSNCVNCQGDDHWYLECTAKPGIPLREDIVVKLAKKKKKQQQKPPVSLVNSVRRVTVTTGGDGKHGSSEGLELYSSPSVTDTIDLTRETFAAVKPPVNFPTTPARSDDDGVAT